MDSETLYEEAVEWLREHYEHELVPAHRLNEHFLGGPAPSDAKTIDVIAVADSGMSTVISQFYLTQVSSALGGRVAGLPGSEDLWIRKRFHGWFTLELKANII